ncbi:MAG: ferrous iron transporter B [Phycisphaerae bacterium]|nr:ferrous iron transporter B [Phycisphaerae bacterium]
MIGTEQQASDSPSAQRVHAPPRRVALVGNPNVGKTTLFNRMCGLRAKTANFPGSTVDARVGTTYLPRPSGTSGGATAVEVVDLPGIYALDLDLPESRLCRECLSGQLAECHPDAMIVVLDATNLARNLQFLVSATRSGLPTVVAVTMADIAARKGLSIDAHLLAQHVHCPAVVVSGRSGKGVDRLVQALPDAAPCTPTLNPGETVAMWASRVIEESVGGERAAGTDHDTVTDRVDAAFTHPVLGTLIFALVMSGLFATIFSLAQLPMVGIDWLFEKLGGWIAMQLGDGALGSLLSQGIIGGIAGTVVFLPQICILFFLLSLLEDTGYLARAAFVMDRVMCRFGLPGQAFVPLLSSHACALPGIMSTRLIPDRRDRLATILVAPFMSCSARVPVYVLLTTLLFRDHPFIAGLVFAGCYVLGAVAAFLTAFVLRSSILRGRSRPMVLELPSYKMPSLRTALLTTIDRARTFLVNAGTIIMAICIVMWWLSAYPKMEPTVEAEALRGQADALVATDPLNAEALRVDADHVDARAQSAQSFAGRIGSFATPLFAPIGFDRQLTVATMTSFLAREVFASTTKILVGVGEDAEGDGVIETLANARRDDGSPLFTPATSASLLVFFVLAMQCLPTLAVTRRESGSWKWAALQFAWMSGLAYVAAFIVYHGLGLLGIH